MADGLNLPARAPFIAWERREDPMTTTTSTTSTASATGTSILTALGAGSGVDTASLITNLTNAMAQPKQDAITARQTTNSAQVSQLATLANGIDSFASSLNSLLSGGTLFTQPTSTNSAIVSVSAVAGANISGLSSTLQVTQLAQSQSVASASLANAATAVGQGSLTLSIGGLSAKITVDGTNNTLTGLAAAINNANLGVNATVVTDTQGSRLVVKGPTGAANAFTLTANADADADLRRFAYDPSGSGGMTLAQSAQDALLNLDGVSVARSSNSFSDLIPGVKFTLNSAAPGTTVSLGYQQPTDAITQAVNDFVTAYNTLKSALDAATAPPASDGTGAGPLRGDPGIRDMQKKLSQLTLTVLSSTGSGPHTLAEIGVGTNRDGTLSVDSTRLASILASDPGGVEALFNPTQNSSSPMLAITSQMGKVAPGTYTVTDVTTGPPISGKINGVAATVVGNNLVAAANSGAAGLVLKVLGNVASATISIDPGIGGALQSIRDALRSSTGALTTTQDMLTAQAKKISDDNDALTAQIAAYHDRLVTQFGAMDSQVASYKSIQSYLTQQIAVWTNKS